ncbi:MAG: TerC/Alx family metal homeostasis membrane protein [Bacteroidota bacterium]
MHLHEILIFGGFLVFIVLMLFIDIGVFNKEAKEVSFKNALSWTLVWVSLSLIFWGVIYMFGDKIHNPQDINELKQLIARYNHPIDISSNNYEALLVEYRRNLSLEYITGYLIEYALSVDNIFVILMVFYSFNLEKKYYHKVLFWGILGAIIMRFLFIFVSAALIQEFAWVLYGFGILLVFTGVKMYLDRNKKDTIDTANHKIVLLASRIFKVDKEYKGPLFFIKKNGQTYITTLFIVLLVIEFTDVIFAVDSVPAIFSITQDPYIVYFSNIFAIIGLRSLFFLVENMVEKFTYLKIGLAVLLVFIGTKMLIHDFYKIGTMHSLLIVLGILVVSIIISLLFPSKPKSKYRT